MEVVINYWAVLAAAVAAVAIGGVWYGPFFGKQWMRAVGIAMPGEITPAARDSMTRAFLIQLVSLLPTAFVLAHVLYYAGELTELSGLFGAITGAIWVWLAFVMPVTLTAVLWENRSWRYWFIIAGYWLVALAAMSAILTLWQ